MTWDDLLKLLQDIKKNEPDVLQDKVGMIFDNERYNATAVEDLVTGQISLHPQFNETEEDDD